MQELLRTSWLNLLASVTTEHAIREEWDKRCELRFFLNDCQAEVRSPTHGGSLYPVIVTDISFRGVGFCSPIMIPDKAAVELKFCSHDDVHRVFIKWRCVDGRNCRMGGKLVF